MTVAMTGIRPMTGADIQALCRIAADTGFGHGPDYFERCLAEQQEKKRIVLAAEEDGNPVGYGQLVWTPSYPPFRRFDIPEIQDLNVMSSSRRQGVGGRIIDSFENIAKQAGKKEIGISVGLSHDYGAAQRLYARKGYVPDGAGACYDDIPVRRGDIRSVDDFFTLKFIKNL